VKNEDGIGKSMPFIQIMMKWAAMEGEGGGDVKQRCNLTLARVK
jgi:hypothetical protein